MFFSSLLFSSCSCVWVQELYLERFVHVFFSLSSVHDSFITSFIIAVLYQPGLYVVRTNTHRTFDCIFHAIIFFQQIYSPNKNLS